MRFGVIQKRSGRGGEEKKKSHHCFCQELNPGRPVRSVSSILAEPPGGNDIKMAVTEVEWFRKGCLL